MNLSDFYNETSRLADTDKTDINVADVKRVLACSFDVLAQQTSAQAMDIISKGIQAADKRASKKK